MKVEEIAQLLNGKLFGDGESEILRVASLETAAENEISFVEKNEKAESVEQFAQTKADCLIVSENFDAPLPCPFIQVNNPKLAFAKIAKKLHPPNLRNGWHKTAIVPENSDVRANFIGAFVTIGENTNIGKGTQIYDGSKIGNNVTIGKFTRIYPNCVIYDLSLIHI